MARGHVAWNLELNVIITEEGVVDYPTLAVHMETLKFIFIKYRYVCSLSKNANGILLLETNANVIRDQGVFISSNLRE
jgi:hypothetical protein